MIMTSDLTERALLRRMKKQLTSNTVLTEVVQELVEQEEKWGEQNHPNGTGRSERLFGYIAASKYGQFADKAKVVTDSHAQIGTITYADIFVEEVFEALAEEDPAKLRIELIQCAAVAVAWVGKIDRDTAKKAE